MWLAWPDEARKKNLFAIETPGVGSFIATGSWTAAVPGLSDFPEDDWPPVVIPFFGFRIMGLDHARRPGPATCCAGGAGSRPPRWFPWPTFLAFPSGFVAIIAGWYTAEVGRQPWVVYGLLRTADAHTPTPTTSDVLTSLIGYVVVYAVIYSFGLYYIYHLLRDGPTDQAHEITRATAMSDGRRRFGRNRDRRDLDRPGGDLMDASWLAVFWAALIAFAILVYVLLDGFDLGIGVLFGTTRDQNYRGQMLTIAPFWDGNETWLVIIASLFGAFDGDLPAGLYLPACCCCSG